MHDSPPKKYCLFGSIGIDKSGNGVCLHGGGHDKLVQECAIQHKANYYIKVAFVNQNARNVTIVGIYESSEPITVTATQSEDGSGVNILLFIYSALFI